MRYTYIPLLMALALLGLVPAASAQGPAAGSCVLGTAQADLGANNALGRVFNNGSLFYGNGSQAFYFVPQAARKSPIFASGLWVSGKVGGSLRVAGGTFGAPALDFTFWPGPLDNVTGRPVNPASCAAFDRIYQATQDEVAAASRGNATGDVAAWPVELGAPYFVDLDGNGVRGRDLVDLVVNGDTTQVPREPTITRGPNDPGYGVNGRKINIASGELPDVIGTQGIWWVMNDVGGLHPRQATSPLGIEVQVLAFSFSRADALGNTTFYKYRIINKSGTDITDAYVSIFSDPDLGDAGDDNVGSDIAAGLGYVFNFDNEDGTGGGASYGTPPPAIGYDFFQGPIVADGPDAGTDPDTLGTSAFSYFQNGGTGNGDPRNGIELYNYQQGKWGDGSIMRAYGNGFQQTLGEPTVFAFPGDPVTGEAWSTVNPGPGVAAIRGDDRRFAIHTGPFTLGKGDEQDIVFGIVFAQGANNLDSITALRNADKVAQAAFNIGFDIPPPPPPPPLCVEGDATLRPGSGRCLEATTVNGQTTLVWGYPSTSSNYLGRYEVFNGFLRQLDVPDKTYNFEGFNIYRYPTSAFDASTRTLVATYDVVNGIKEVRDLRPDPTVNGETREYISARGNDTGVRYSQPLTGLTNYTDYYYGISAYAYNAFSTPKANESSATLITVRPTNLTTGASAQSAAGDSARVVVVSQAGQGSVKARIVDPEAVTGDRYSVEFFTNPDGTTNYTIRNTTKNTIVLDGAAFYAASGQSPQQVDNVIVADGLSFSVLGPAPDYTSFSVVQNANGVLSPPNGAQLGERNGFPVPEDADFARQQANGRGWFIGAPEFFGLHTYAQFLDNVANLDAAVPFDWELRFPAAGTPSPKGAFIFPGTLYSATAPVVNVPFELWRTGVGTPDDPSDDVRYFPALIDIDFGSPTGGGVFNMLNDAGIRLGYGGPTDTADSEASAGLNDPYSDGIFWIPAANAALTGQAAYDATLAEFTSTPAAARTRAVAARATGSPFNNMALIGWNAGLTATNPAPYALRFPEPGSIFRITTSKPNQPGDRFTLSTDSLQLSVPTAADRETALDRIAAVPNPYFGTSSYESGNLSSVIRFTNLPPESVSIRIFTVSGSLVTTLNKSGSARSLDWNLQTSNNLPVASGMYLVHVEMDGGGERTIKLAVINRRTQVTIF